VLIVHESTEDFDSELIAEVMHATHVVRFFIILSPTYGHPTNRKRKVTLCIRRDFALDADLSDMSKLFGRQLMLTPDEFYCLGGTEYEQLEKIACVWCLVPVVWVWALVPPLLGLNCCCRYRRSACAHMSA